MRPNRIRYLYAVMKDNKYLRILSKKNGLHDWVDEPAFADHLSYRRAFAYARAVAGRVEIIAPGQGASNEKKHGPCERKPLEYSRG